MPSRKQQNRTNLLPSMLDGLSELTPNLGRETLAHNAEGPSVLLEPERQDLFISDAGNPEAAAGSTRGHIAEFYHSIRNAPKPYYDDGNGIVIFCNDCREILPLLAKCDLVITDPPYGISHSTGWSRDLWGGVSVSWNGASVEGDTDTSMRDWLVEQIGTTPAFVFGTWRISRPASAHTVLVWDKGPASGMGDLSVPFKPSWEEIYLIGKGCYQGSRDEGVLKGFYVPPRISMGRQHPMEKPVSLLRYLISKTTADTIIDPFMGSGTTLRAAKDLGRRAIGIEIEERYCEIAAMRLSQEVMAL